MRGPGISSCTRCILEHRRIHACHARSSNIDIHALEVVRYAQLPKLEFWIAVWCVGPVVFETIQVLVAFTTYFAAIWLLLFHADGSGVGYRGQRINNGECSILVLFQLLILMTVLHTS